ncbi:MAG: hypothetical protein K6G11_10050, partial [Lachnospiraceae bacterium]|nr:hypothetical protein [Lachnospiraceae bacterium]
MREITIDEVKTIDAEKVKKYKDSLKRFNKESENPYKSLIDVYGPNGKIPESIGVPNANEYSDIVIDKGANEELTDEVIAAIVIGEAIEESRLKKTFSSSSTMFNAVETNKLHIVDNVVKGDQREKNLAPILIEARKEANKKIEDYKNGNKGPVLLCLKRFVNYCKKYNLDNPPIDYRANISPIPSNAAISSIARKIIDNKAFKKAGFNKGFNRAQEANLKGTVKEIDYAVSVVKEKETFINKFNEMSKEQKEEALTDIILKQFISGMGVKDRQARADQKDNILTGCLTGLGISNIEEPGQPAKAQEIINNDNKIIKFASDLSETIKKYKVNEIKAILLKENGYNRLKSMYGPEIKKSVYFKRIIDAQNENDLIKAVMNADNFSGVGLENAFPGVKLPDEASEINKSTESDFNKELKQIKDKVIETVFKNHLQAEIEQYGLKSFTLDEMKKNATFIEELYNNIDRNHHAWKTSKNYKDMRSKLKELRDYTKELANSGRVLNTEDVDKYTQLSKEVFDLSGVYIDNKTEADSDYAKNRVAAVKDLRLKLGANIHSIENAVDKVISEKSGELFEENGKKFEEKFIYSKEGLDIFKGARFKTTTLTSPMYNVSRTANQSFTVLALANTGKYRMEDILDPEKLVNEKQQMFRNVAAFTSTITDEGQKWLAENIVGGFEKMKAFMNETAEKIDFTDPDLFNNEEYIKLLNIGTVQYDAWQEMSNNKEAISNVLKEKNLPFKDFDEYHKDLINGFYSIATIGSLKINSMKAAGQVVIDKGEKINKDFLTFFEEGVYCDYLQKKMVEQYKSRGNK